MVPISPADDAWEWKEGDLADHSASVIESPCVQATRHGALMGMCMAWWGRLSRAQDAPSFIRRMLRNSRYSQPGVVDPASRMATPQARECHTHSRITDADTLKIFRGAVENGIDAPCTHCLRHGDPMHAQE
eukprot:COSAG01_NODE_74_length_28433_cov_41.582269_25_plen_131_part_00